MPDDPRETEVEEDVASTETEAEVEETEEVETETETEGDAEEGETEVEAEAEDEAGAGEQTQRPSRGDQALNAGNLRRQNSELRARLERQERDIEEIKRGRQQTGPTAEELAAERDRLAMMTPEERADEKIKQSEGRLRGELQATRFMLADNADKSAYEAKAVSNPVFAKYGDRVEDELGRLRKQGMNAPRDRILRYLIGDDAMKRQGDAGTRQRRTAAATRERQTTKPGNGAARSDATTDRRKAGKTAADRLKDVTF